MGVLTLYSKVICHSIGSEGESREGGRGKGKIGKVSFLLSGVNFPIKNLSFSDFSRSQKVSVFRWSVT